MSEAQRKRLRVIKYVSAVVYILLTALAFGLVEHQLAWAATFFWISIPFAVLLYVAIVREEHHG
jgi:hypothetical protein